MKILEKSAPRALKVVHYPEPVLRMQAALVERITPEIQRFIEEMGEAMYDHNGVGLAAPQVGVSLRIAVIDAGEGKGLQEFINPEIILREGTQTGVEGCLSLPRLHGDVVRAERIILRALNRRGRRITMAGEDFWARVVQHELDHLDGILFTDCALPDSLRWVTGEVDAEGHYIEQPTTLAEALAVFTGTAEIEKQA